MLRGKSLSAGKSHEIRCEAIGAKPQASISWWVGGKEVNCKIEFRSKTLEGKALDQYNQGLLKYWVDLNCYFNAICLSLDSNGIQWNGNNDIQNTIVMLLCLGWKFQYFEIII